MHFLQGFTTSHLSPDFKSEFQWNLFVIVWPGQKEEASGSPLIPVNDLKAILNLAREQYLKMFDSTLPSAATCLTDDEISEETGMD